MNPSLFFDNFSLLSDSPDGVQKLREMILQLAVMGKLVPQDPNDEPASVLMEKIRDEKERLVKEGKIKSFNSFHEVSKDEIKYELPLNWSCVRLGELLLSLKGGGTPSKRISAYWNGDIPWASVKDLGKSKYLTSTVDTITSEGLLDSSSNLIAKGNVIVCTRMGLGKIAINNIDVAINQDLKALEISIHVSIDFFYNLYRTLKLQGTGMTVEGIRQETLLNIPVPLPPLEEQKRIVAKVNQLMTLCDELEALHQHRNESRVHLNNAAINGLLDAGSANEFNELWQLIYNNFDLLYDNLDNVTKLRQAILQLAVMGKLVPQDPKDEPASMLLEKIRDEKERLVKEGKIGRIKDVTEIERIDIPFDVPKGWSYEKLGNVCFVTKLAGFEYTQYFNLCDYGEVPVIRAQNIKNDRILKEKLKYIDLKTSLLLERSALTKQCLLMTFIGAGIGEVAIFNENERWHLAPNVAKLEPFNNYGEKINSRFLLIYLLSNFGKDEIFKHRKSTAQPSLSMGTIRDINLAFPPLEEQKRIVDKVDQLITLCDELEISIKKAQEDGEKITNAIVSNLTAM